MNRVSSILVIVLGAIGLAGSVVHGYVLGVVADRPESEGAFRGAEQATLTVFEIAGAVAGLALMTIGTVLLIKSRTRPHH